MRRFVSQLAYVLVPHCVFLTPVSTAVSKWISQPHMDSVVYEAKDVTHDMRNLTSLSTEPSHLSKSLAHWSLKVYPIEIAADLMA